MKSIHLEFEPISRKKGMTPSRAANYQSGERLWDDYYGRTYYNRSRPDLLHADIMRPLDAPPGYSDRQILWREADRAEKRSDARTARRAIGSLPNELTLEENIELVQEYITENFVSLGLCVDYAIHEIRNADDPTKNNPHVHMLITDRPVGRYGFCPKKDRNLIKRSNIKLWRERWAETLNRAYERKGLEVRVTAKGYIEREMFDREPKKSLQRGDVYLERKGIRTERGDENREIKARNEKREVKREKKRDHGRSR